ncbi:unnamed protein product [Mesocestoides corti]|uniref:Uncharacterized protein n=1 Tax=Mesocestoides corti TaxID=53468 RepID=A0A0R3UQP3_MESCO|nr:unnamed protein product [Mesocestoides corti]
MAEFIQQSDGHEIQGQYITGENENFEQPYSYIHLLADTEPPQEPHHVEYQMTDAASLPYDSQQFWPSGSMPEVLPQQTGSPNPQHSTQHFPAPFYTSPLQIQPNTTAMPSSTFVQHTSNPYPYPFSSYQIESQNLVTQHLERHPSAIYRAHTQPSASVHHFMAAPDNQADMMCSPTPLQSAPLCISVTNANIDAANSAQGQSRQTTLDEPCTSRLQDDDHSVKMSRDTHFQLCSFLPPRTSLSEFMCASAESHQPICVERRAFQRKKKQLPWS